MITDAEDVGGLVQAVFDVEIAPRVRARHIRAAGIDEVRDVGEDDRRLAVGGLIMGQGRPAAEVMDDAEGDLHEPQGQERGEARQEELFRPTAV